MRSWRAVLIFWAFLVVFFCAVVMASQARADSSFDNWFHLTHDDTDCSLPLDPAVQPTPDEITEAAAYVELKSLPGIILAIPQDCMGYEYQMTPSYELSRNPYLGLTYMYDDIVLMWDGWRRTEGLTILVHELRHQRQSELGLYGSECDSTDYGSRWAAEHGNEQAFYREMLYGLPMCPGGRMYDPEDMTWDKDNPHGVKTFGGIDYDEWNLQIWKDAQ